MKGRVVGSASRGMRTREGQSIQINREARGGKRMWCQGWTDEVLIVAVGTLVGSRGVLQSVRGFDCPRAPFCEYVRHPARARPPLFRVVTPQRRRQP